MNRTIMLITACCAMLLVACAEVTPRGGATPTPTPEPQPGLVAYIADDDLWVYDPETDEARRLTTDVRETRESEPRFIDATRIAFIASGGLDDSSLVVIDVESGSAEVIVEDGYTIMALDPGPDGATIAFIDVRHDGEGIHRLKSVPVTGGEAREITTLGEVPGRGASSEDEVSVAWSPDGTMLLVTDTHVDREHPVRVLDLDGDDVMKPMVGTHARMSPDGRSILTRGFAGTSEPAWSLLDLADGTSQTLPISPGTNNLVFSPDGRKVAYDTSWYGDIPLGTVRYEGAPAVYVYNFSRGTERMLVGGAMKPRWISDDEMLVTGATYPDSNTLNSWDFMGGASRVTSDGTRYPITWTTTKEADSSTYDADVWLG